MSLISRNNLKPAARALLASALCLLSAGAATAEELLMIELPDPATAQAAAEPPEAAKPQAPPAAAPDLNVRPGTLAGPLSGGLADFNFTGTDILLVLKIIASRRKLNIVPSPGVKGNVTLSLRQVPFDEGFRILLEKLDLVAIQRGGGVIEVMPGSEMPLVAEKVALKNRPAADIKAALEALLTPDEKKRLTIAADYASNSLMISAAAAQMPGLRAMITDLDQKAPQIRIKGPHTRAAQR
ncbi:MAG: secretin N-terminal domain-containing protein [Elusimicrobiota bacterium]